MNTSSTHGQSAPSDNVGYQERFGYIDCAGRREGTDLPAAVHWPFIDKGDSGLAGTFGILPVGRSGPPSSNEHIANAGSDGLVFGEALNVALELNRLFRRAWVDLPNTLSSPLNRLFLHVRLQQSWRRPDPWSHTAFGPWSDLTPKMPNRSQFWPRYPDIRDIPVALQPETYVRHFHAARQAYRQLADLISHSAA